MKKNNHYEKLVFYQNNGNHDLIVTVRNRS
jgi:hypothetical protein